MAAHAATFANLQFATNVAFCALLPCIAVVHLYILHVVTVVFAIVAIYAWSCTFEAAKVDTLQQISVLAAIVVLGLLALKTPGMDCSTCLEKGTVTYETLNNHMKRHAQIESAMQHFFGKNSDLWLLKTQKGAEIKWPECFDFVTQEWDPCDMQKVIETELTCKK